MRGHEGGWEVSEFQTRAQRMAGEKVNSSLTSGNSDGRRNKLRISHVRMSEGQTLGGFMGVFHPETTLPSERAAEAPWGCSPDGGRSLQGPALPTRPPALPTPPQKGGPPGGRVL